MDKKLTLLAGVAALFLVLFVATQFKTAGTGVSPDILYLTSPVTSFTGTVDKVDGNTLTVSQTMILTQTGTTAVPPAGVAGGKPPAVSPSPMPTPASKKITFRVKITDKTGVTRSASAIPYLFKTAAATAGDQKLSINDIKAGQSVSVSTATDLRTNTSGVLEATTVRLSNAITNINGRVVSIDNQVLTIKGFVPTANSGAAAAGRPAAPTEAEYRVTVTPETEISRYKTTAAVADPGKTPAAPEKERLTLADLKKDMQVTVYTDQDVTTATTLNALRIEPFAAPVANTVAPVVSPSPASTSSAAVEAEKK